MKTSRFLLPLIATFALDATVPAQEPERPLERAEKVKPEGHVEEAPEFRKQAKRKEGDPRREGERRKERPDAPHNERFAQMKREIEELHRDGKHDQAENRMREMKNDWEREQNAHRKGAEGEGPAKIRHVMEAVRHLRAAGLKEPAEHLEQLANRMREEFEQQQKSQKDKQSEGDRAAGASREVAELREQVQKMAREMEQLRGELKNRRVEEMKKEN